MVKPAPQPSARTPPLGKRAFGRTTLTLHEQTTGEWDIIGKIVGK